MWWQAAAIASRKENAKAVLDAKGPEALAQWVLSQKRVLLTDTTFRDAHQSLVATRFRTVDLVGAADLQTELLGDLFSIECWGGATYDVCMRFLREGASSSSSWCSSVCGRLSSSSVVCGARRCRVCESRLGLRGMDSNTLASRNACWAGTSMAALSIFLSLWD